MATRPSYEELEKRVKDLENSLQEDQAIHALFSSAPYGIFLIDISGKVLFTNRTGARILGKEPKEVVGTTLAQHFPPDTAEKRRLKGMEALRTGSPQTFEDRVGDRWYFSTVFPTTDKTGNQTRLAIYSEDITDRKRAEAALRESEEKYRFLTENMMDMVWIIDRDLRTTYVSPSIEKVLGFTPQERQQQAIEAAVTPESLQEIQRRFIEELQRDQEEGIDQERSVIIEVEYYRKDGSTVWMENRVQAIRDSENAIVGIMGVSRDITRRKRAEEELKKSEEKYKLLADHSADVIYRIDIATEQYTYISPSIEKLLGYTVAEGLSLSARDSLTEKSYIKQREGLIKALSNNRTTPAILELEAVHKDGHTLPVETHVNFVFDEQGNPVEVLGVVRDISKRKEIEAQRKKLEEQLLQARKMEAISVLAGGIAHEFNNALMAIMGNIELLRMDLPEDDKRDKCFEAMKRSSHRMSRLTGQLLAYAQGGKYQAKNLRLDDFVKETMPILQHDLSPEVSVETSFQRDIRHTRADYAQLQMVLAAILANSNEAIESKGCIKIAVENREVDEAFAEQHLGLKTGSYVCLCIEDDGRGMDEEERAKIFDPFFTTKFQGRGMGMAAVYGIVKNHDGWISVDSEVGKGTLVRIYLPVVEVEERSEEAPKTKPLKGTGTILLIEDEDMIIDVIQAILEQLGYRVMTAKTGEDAIQIARSFDGDIDLALLDIKLPDMEGGKVYPRIMESRPYLKVIVCSGYAIDGPAQKILDSGAQGFLQKPFSISSLSEKLKEVLVGPLVPSILR